MRRWRECNERHVATKGKDIPLSMRRWRECNERERRCVLILLNYFPRKK